MSSNSSRIPPLTAELVTFESLKNQRIILFNSNLVPSFLIGSSSFLQDIRTTIKART